MIVRMIVVSTPGGDCTSPGGEAVSPGSVCVSPGPGDATPGVDISPANAATERTKVKAMASMKRFMRVTPY
jgi:hypothetical protein